MIAFLPAKRRLNRTMDEQPNKHPGGSSGKAPGSCTDWRRQSGRCRHVLPKPHRQADTHETLGPPKHPARTIFGIVLITLLARVVAADGAVTLGPEGEVQIENVGEHHRPRFAVFNGYYGPVQIEVRLGKHRNVRLDPPLPLRVSVPGRAHVSLFSVAPQTPFEDWKYKWKATMVLGDPSARHAPAAPYRIPVCEGGPYRITQGFGGRHTHTGPQNHFSVDFGLPSGTAVCTARGGIVMAMAMKASDVPTPTNLGSVGNFVRVLHDDGTIGLYAHLQRGSAMIRPGDRVATGQTIARSGESGSATGPHLHFSVQRNHRMDLVSVPFQMRDLTGQTLEPKAGTWAGNP
jgi:murein DD-endopeptidase MepM/ murein hydrolase activator NlpD